MGFEDDNSSSLSSSSNSSSSSCSNDVKVGISSSPSMETDEQQAPLLLSHKRKAGRRKFKETRHPIYRGVRRRNGSKWVCEMREPNKKTRIWLGTYATPEMAARAHDVAALALRGDGAMLNFADSASCLPRAQSSSTRDIQIAAFQAAEAFRSVPSLDAHFSLPSSMNSLRGDSQGKSTEDEDVKNVEERVCDDTSSTSVFMDEEAVFNMPVFIDSMAEGLLLTPPAMKKGFHWDDMGDDIDLTLWRD